MTEEDANDKGLMAGLAAHTKAAGAGTPRRPRQLTRIRRYALRQPDFIPNRSWLRTSVLRREIIAVSGKHQNP